MPSGLDIKLQDLAKLALGTPQLSQVNIAVLQSLIEILLKKLNCENETVSLNAYESKHLENILKTAKISPLIFNTEQIETISDKLERVIVLQARVNEMNEKLDKHLEKVHRISNFNETAVSWENWPSYGCEHLCTICDEKNEIACALLKNTDFIKKLLRRMSAPIVEHLFYFEEKLEKLNEEFTKFIKQAEEEYLKIQLLEKCIEELEKLRQTTKEQESQFLGTMEEIQDILDTKLDKIHIPALKKYIRDNFKEINQSINTLQEKRDCPKAAGVILENVRCMSCGNNKVCTDSIEQPTAMLPSVSEKPVKLSKFCGTLNNLCKTPKGMTAMSWSLNDSVKFRPSKQMKNVSSLTQCRKPGEDFELLKGFDGKLYRKG